MYSRGTILSRREPFETPDPKATPPVEGDPRYIYNEVEVIGTSPIAYMGGEAASWSGVGAQGVIVVPHGAFGGTIDRPLGELQRDYEIKSEPEPTVVSPSIRVINAHTREAGPSPEEQFAETAAAEAAQSNGRRRKAA